MNSPFAIHHSPRPDFAFFFFKLTLIWPLRRAVSSFFILFLFIFLIVLPVQGETPEKNQEAAYPNHSDVRAATLYDGLILAQAGNRKKSAAAAKKTEKSEKNPTKETKPADEPQVTLAKPKQAESHWFGRVFFSYGLPVSSIKDYINSPLGGRAEFGYQFGRSWAYQPFVFADYDTAAGKTTDTSKIDNYQSFAFGAGFAVALRLSSRWGLSPFLAGGYNIGSLQRVADTVNFRLPLAEAGLSLSFQITPRIAAVYQGSYRHVFDPDVPGGYVMNRLGIGLRW